MENINESIQEDLNDLDVDETTKNEEEELDEEIEDDTNQNETEKWKKIAENQRIRAEKAEKLAKEAKKNGSSKEEKQTPKNKELQLSAKDSARLLQANIPVDDWDDVIEYANFKGININDALSSSVVKATLSEKAEERRTASATNTGGGKRGSSRISGETLLEKALSSGQLPEDDASMNALIAARYKPRA